MWSVIVVRKGLGSNVWKAASLLQSDLKRLSSHRVELKDHFEFAPTRILIEVRANKEAPESFRIRTDRQGVVVTGSDDRGAAFGVYELCERLGVDPLHIWTGIAPEKRKVLVMRKVDYIEGSPSVRWRGLFHDDEDILPHPFRADGVPDPNGTVPKIWYERYFETALRLKMNMVAPWVRTRRNFEIQKMASDWGLAYTSHHYDILLSDPYHFNRGLAQSRGVEPVWDWLQNRDGILKYWRAGVEENRGITAIYPIGLRGTNDFSYRFPAGWSQDQKIAAYNDALVLQAGLVDQLLPKGKPQLKHFTMYTEMLPFYQTGKLIVPPDTIVVWPDENDGVMRGLPSKCASGNHGVYYHLAYLGGSPTKQLFSTVPLGRIEREFRKIFAAGATEFVLTNVSEIREYSMGTRMIADLMWHGDEAFRNPDAADRFLSWWCREYFGSDMASQTVNGFYSNVRKPIDMRVGGDKVLGAVASLAKKFRGEQFVPADRETLPMLNARIAAAEALAKSIADVKGRIRSYEKRRFYFESVELPVAVDRFNCRAAALLVEAMSEVDRAKSIEMCRAAAGILDRLDGLLRQAERPPFERWYGETWIAERSRAIVWPRRELAKLIATLPKA
jgi:hypothetical protein